MQPRLGHQGNRGTWGSSPGRGNAARVVQTPRSAPSACRLSPARPFQTLRSPAPAQTSPEARGRGLRSAARPAPLTLPPQPLPRQSLPIPSPPPCPRPLPTSQTRAYLPSPPHRPAHTPTSQSLQPLPTYPIPAPAPSRVLQGLPRPPVSPLFGARLAPRPPPLAGLRTLLRAWANSRLSSPGPRTQPGRSEQGQGRAGPGPAAPALL